MTILLLLSLFVLASANLLSAAGSPFTGIETMSAEKMRQLPNLRLKLGVALQVEDLSAYSPIELKVLRNSIFAQYGLRFKTDWLQRYFASRPWYRPKADFSYAVVTAVDTENAKLFLTVERRLDQRQVDSQKRNDIVVLEEGYCEEETSYEIYRFAFKDGGQLVFTTEKMSMYGYRYDRKEHIGQWISIGENQIQYQLADSRPNQLALSPGTHTCKRID
jgi:hypothetical protein